MDVFLNHVEVVQQPLSGGAHIDLASGAGHEPLVGVIQDATGLIQPREEPGATAFGSLQRNPLPSGHRPGSIGELFGTQELAPDRASEEIVGALGRELKMSGEEARQRQRRNSMASIANSGRSSVGAQRLSLTGKAMELTTRGNAAWGTTGKLIRRSGGMEHWGSGGMGRLKGFSVKIADQPISI
jgi:hypothetical protein